MMKLLQIAAVSTVLASTLPVRAEIPAVEDIHHIARDVLPYCVATRQAADELIAKRLKMVRSGEYEGSAGEKVLIELDENLAKHQSAMANPECKGLLATQEALVKSWSNPDTVQEQLPLVREAVDRSRNCVESQDLLEDLAAERDLIVARGADPDDLVLIDDEVRLAQSSMAISYCGDVRQDKANSPAHWHAEQCLLISRDIGIMEGDVSYKLRNLDKVRERQRGRRNVICAQYGEGGVCELYFPEFKTVIMAQARELLSEIGDHELRSRHLSCPALW